VRPQAIGVEMAFQLGDDDIERCIDGGRTLVAGGS